MNKTRVAALTTLGSCLEPKGTMDRLEASFRLDDHLGLTELGLEV